MDHGVFEAGSIAGSEELLRVSSTGLYPNSFGMASCKSRMPSSLLTVPLRPPTAMTFVV
jgi:hypothetical protein